MKLKHITATTALLALLGSAAQAQVVIYDNTTTLVSAYAEGGATTGNKVTALMADDINPVAGSAGKGVTQFKFSVYTGGKATSTFTAAVHVRFYDDQAPDFSGGPGNYIGGVDFTPTVFTGGSTVSLFTYTAPIGTTVFNIPSDDSLWAGVTFDNGGVAATTAANLNTLGQGLFNPPTVGGSDNRFFISDAAGLFASNNPAGTSTYAFNPPTISNFGWQFQIAAAPEPCAWAGLIIGGLGLGLLGLRAYKRRLEDAFGPAV